MASHKKPAVAKGNRDSIYYRRPWAPENTYLKKNSLCNMLIPAKLQNSKIQQFNQKQQSVVSQDSGFQIST